MTPLTEYFSLEELTVSQTAARRGIDNTPTPEIFRNLVRLCDEILEPLRKAVGRALIVSSGYRSPALNAAVGGSKNSDHMLGLAADITAQGMSLDALMEAVHALSPYVPLKQGIREFPPLGWVHVSCFPSTANKPEPEFLVATYDDGKTIYSKWSV